MATDVETRALRRELHELGLTMKNIAKALNQLVYMMKEDRRQMKEEDGDASSVPIDRSA